MATEIKDEDSYVKYAEYIIHELQNTFRSKINMQHIAVIDTCVQLEDICYGQGLRESSTADNIWQHKNCARTYQHTCETMLRNLEGKDYNWPKIVEENERNPRAIYMHIMKEDDGRSKRRSSLETPFRPSKAKAPKTDTAASNKVNNLKNKNKKGKSFGHLPTRAPPPATATSAAPAKAPTENLHVTFGTTTVMAHVGIPAPLFPSAGMEDTSVAALHRSVSVPADDVFNLDFLDDENSNSIHVYNADAWQTAAVKAEAASSSSSSSYSKEDVLDDVWKSALEEQQSKQEIERLQREQIEQKQDNMRRIREEGQQTFIEKERQEQEEALRREQELAEEKSRLAEERERQRKERGEATQTVDLDSQRDIDMLDGDDWGGLGL